MHTHTQAVYMCAHTDTHIHTHTCYISHIHVCMHRYLEAYAKGEASEAVARLMDLNPTKATLVIEKDGVMQEETEIDASLLQVCVYVCMCVCIYIYIYM